MKGRTVLLRCAALAAIAALTIAAHGQSDAWVVGMKCSAGMVNCEPTTQVQNCIGNPNVLPEERSARVWTASKIEQRALTRQDLMLSIPDGTPAVD